MNPWFLSGKKRLLSHALFGRLSPLDTWLAGCLSPHKRLWVLAYHRINDLPDAGFPFNDEIISATADAFRAQLKWLARYFQVINHHDLLSYQQGELHFNKPPCLITFDDGYADNQTVALPILQEMGMTATVFVTTGAIDQQELFWFDKVAYWINHIRPQMLRLDAGRFVMEVSTDNRKRVRQAIGRYLASVSEPHRLLFLQELEAVSGLSIPTEVAELAKPLSWEQARSLSAGGIELGVHTVAHGFLDRMTPAEIESELLTAKQRLQAETGQTSISLSYPTGHYNAEVVAIAQRLGFHFGHTYKHQVANLAEIQHGTPTAFEIPRLHVEPFVDMPLFKANMLLPRWFAD